MKFHEESVTLFIHLSLLTDPQHLEGFLLCVERDSFDMKLQVNFAILWTMIKIIYPQLPQATEEGRERSNIPSQEELSVKHFILATRGI